MCRPYKDFGKGFYLTVMKDQAEKMANRVARIYGESPVLNIYEIADSFMDTDELKIKDFGEETSPEWARFVRNNRSKKFKDYSDPECNLDNKYDIIPYREGDCFVKESRCLTMGKEHQMMEYMVQDLVEMLTEGAGIEYDDAMHTIYDSDIYEKLMDAETGLYRESP